MTNARTSKTENRARAARMGFRVDEATKRLVERAAELERRRVTDFCLTALTEAAQRTIARHEALVLSDDARTRFFDILVNPPAPHERLRRALEAERRRVLP
jgi:uncharacterized protein (DUF1778 family)